MSCDEELAILAPLNPLTRHVLLETLDASGTRTPVTTGTVTGFLATSDEPDATAADAALVATCAHVGGNEIVDGEDDLHPPGTWQIKFSPATFTVSRLDGLFLDTGDEPYLIITTPNDRVTEKLRYQRSLRADIA